jgi:hypothetical protein
MWHGKVSARASIQRAALSIRTFEGVKESPRFEYFLHLIVISDDRG